MTIRLLLAETRRYAAAAKGSLFALLALGAAWPFAVRLLAGWPGAPSPADAADPTLVVMESMVTLWGIAVLAGFVWLVVSIVWAARQPALDAEAAVHLQSLRDRAIIEGHDLVEVHHTRWATQAGQQAVIVNVGAGQTSEVWLPEVRLPDRSFALLTREGERTGIVGWASAEQVTATHRHLHRAALHRPARGRRRSVEDVGAVVAEAEALVRGKE